MLSLQKSWIYNFSLVVLLLFVSLSGGEAAFIWFHIKPQLKGGQVPPRWGSFSSAPAVVRRTRGPGLIMGFYSYARAEQAVSSLAESNGLCLDDGSSVHRPRHKASIMPLLIWVVNMSPGSC